MVPNHRRSFSEAGEASRLANPGSAEARMYPHLHLAPFATSVMDYSERAAGLNAALHLNASAMLSPSIPAVVPSQPGMGSCVDHLLVPSYAAGVGTIPAGVMPPDYMLVTRSPHFMPPLGLHHQENLRALQLSNQHHYAIAGNSGAGLDPATAAAAAGMVGLGRGGLALSSGLPFHRAPGSFLLHSQPAPGAPLVGGGGGIPQQTPRKENNHGGDPTLQGDFKKDGPAPGVFMGDPNDPQNACGADKRLRASVDGDRTAAGGSEQAESAVNFPKMKQNLKQRSLLCDILEYQGQHLNK